MKSLSLLTVAFLALSAPLAFASGDNIDAALKDKVTAEMTAQGYEVRKIDSEDGMIEVYAVKDGKTYELYLDAQLKIVKSKTE
ncbi:PepSY domain-containing protein [Gemmobacter fulvus]|uniref:PepSY domain-containing protein n=1 Tax=Gemmobacter fulvus TaxID=2840474 RepID=A0A975P852_9RHOB|nr:PepSY domain-containing protein [Gemmobacter fulvus]MBT9248087.1 PepSY domain-containing protein [Gemmobacter fulvus]MDQ1847754.1 PepSY domain-containing protein [Gemmobacter fulvus]QWK90778.1 PepSY domain-containing protein [Gemmobacter fulvus]